MAVPKTASLGPFLTLTKGMRVRVNAISPTSGANVAGVIVSNVAISVDQSDFSGPPPPPPSPVTGAYLPAGAV